MTYARFLPLRAGSSTAARPPSSSPHAVYPVEDRPREGLLDRTLVVPKWLAFAAVACVLLPGSLGRGLATIPISLAAIALLPLAWFSFSGYVLPTRALTHAHLLVSGLEYAKGRPDRRGGHPSADGPRGRIEPAAGANA